MTPTRHFFARAILMRVHGRWTKARSNGETVHFEGFAAGTIVVKTHERHLYYVLRGKQALRFPVGVGKAGMQWSRATRVANKYVRPAL